ncbi:MAG TPA: PfkB family carbohydrate kinase [Gaiellaceae bacterium]|nr:PfkB family carbohydrate kinase [Gaiellaceae bacterium]
MPGIAVVGNLSRDLVDGKAPRPGGPPYWAARALRALGARALVVAKCADEDRRMFTRALVPLGLPVLWRPAQATATYAFRYEGDHREMDVLAIGDAWTPEDVRSLGGARWVHAGALAQSDFPAETMAKLANGRRVSLDGQGLVRPPRTGPLELNDGYDPEVLRHVTVLKLSEEEAQALVGEPDEEALRSLGVPEVLVTFGSRGSLVLADGKLERVPASVIDGAADPTGAGDAFAAAYIVSRSSGHAPAAAARRASELVAGLLSRRLR